MGQRAFGIYLVMITLLIGGCRTARVIRDPEFATLESDTFRSWESPDAVSEAMADVPQWEGARPLGEYIAQALSQNPEIHAIRKRMEALALQVPVAASLQDPTFGVTVLPEQVQTAAGQQEMLLSAGQKFPWFGKLSAKAIAAR